MAGGSGEALYIQIDRELQGHVSSDSLSRSIFKVPNPLRKINEMAYEPQVISIGPYHHDKGHLKAMEVHKKHYLKMLLNRKKENTAEKYVKALEGLKEEALKFYSEPPDQKVGDQFVKMMLFDGFFVVELIRKSAMKELREENDHLLTHFFFRTVMRDLLLIENQLPFFILMELFDMTKMPNEANQNFMHMAINCFSIMMPGPCNKKIENHRSIKHLLGLLHDSCVSADYGGSSKEDEGSLDEEKLLPRESLDEKVNPLSLSSNVSPSESPEGVRLRSPEAMAIACSAKSISSSTTKPSEIVKSLPSDAVLMNPNLSSLKSVSSAESKSQVSDVTNRIQNCSASSVSFSPTKTSEEEKSIPSNTALMTPQHSEIQAESVSFVVSKPRMNVGSFLSSDEDHRHFSAVTDAPLVSFPPSKTSEGVNSLLSDAILTNIHRSEMEAESESFVVCESAVRATEDYHHRHGSMKLNDAPFVKFSASKTSKEAIPQTEKSESVGIFEPSDVSLGDTPFVRYWPSEFWFAAARFIRLLLAIMERDEKNCNWRTIGSASELHEAGIKFKDIKGGFFSINFKKTVMSIPTLKIVDDTESILRNLVAYEQCYGYISSRRFTDYIRLMDCLINTRKDVELLCRSKVIENMLGDNEVVTDIFNRICDNVFIVEEDFVYAKTFIKVNEHCNGNFIRWKAKLRHIYNYYVDTNPWISNSVIAAVFMLLLTVLQGVYSVLAYHRQH